MDEKWFMPTGASTRVTRGRKKSRGRPRADHRTPEQTRSRLIEAAADVFAEAGYTGASIQAIASRAGVTSGTIYRHFDSKADLLLAVVDQAIQSVPIVEELESGSEVSAASLARLVSSYSEPGPRRIRRLAIEVHAAASRDADAAELLLRFNRRIHATACARLEAGVASGMLPEELDVPHTASLLLIVVMGLAHLDTLEPDLLGDPGWKRFLEGAVEDLLGNRRHRSTR